MNQVKPLPSPEQLKPLMDQLLTQHPSWEVEKVILATQYKSPSPWAYDEGDTVTVDAHIVSQGRKWVITLWAVRGGMEGLWLLHALVRRQHSISARITTHQAFRLGDVPAQLPDSIAREVAWITS